MRNQLGLWWGPDIHDILFNIVCLISGWFFIPLDDIYEFVLYLLLSYPCFLWRCWCPLTRYALFAPPNSKIPWMCMLSWAMSMFDVIIDCLDACLIVFDENTYYVSNLQTNLSCFMIALEKPFKYALWFSLMIRLSYLANYFFEITLVYLGILN